MTKNNNNISFSIILRTTIIKKSNITQNGVNKSAMNMNEIYNTFKYKLAKHTSGKGNSTTNSSVLHIFQTQETNS